MNNRYCLRIPHVYDAMVNQALAELPNECCGILAGHKADGVGVVALRLPLVNDLTSPIRFHSEPRSLLIADKAMRGRPRRSCDISLASDVGRLLPSRTDLAENYRGDSMMNLIISLQAAEPKVRRGFCMPPISRRRCGKSRKIPGADRQKGFMLRIGAASRET